MEELPGLALIIAIIGLYCWLSYLFVVNLAWPLAVVIIVSGLLTGFGLAVWAAATVTMGQNVPDVGPAQVLSGAIGGREKPGLPLRDTAWPNYFVAQWKTDLTAMWARLTPILRRFWEPVRSYTDEPGLLLVWPIAAGIGVFLVTFTASAVATATAVTVVVTVVTLAARVAGTLTVGALRLADRLRQAWFKAQASCPSDYHVTNLPAFACPGCAAVHRDLRPGKLGVLGRRCGCGHLLPTTVTRAALTLQALCPLDGQPLHKGAASLTDLRIPLFGPVSSGKSRLAMAGLVALRAHAAASGVAFGFPDPKNEKTYTDMERTMASAVVDIPKTQVLWRPRPVSITLAAQKRRAFVHVFDAAGERYVRRDDNAELSYLDVARTLIFTLDPFSIPDVKARLSGGFGSVLKRANATDHDPNDAYNSTATRLRDHHVHTRDQRLAIVVTKADLLTGLPIASRLDPVSASIRAWLMERSMDNLVLSAERDFGTVCYFLVSSLTDKPADPLSPAAPFAWLISSDGFPLPVISRRGSRPLGPGTTTAGGTTP